jgi:AcrR family transcriptional regulator
MESVRDRLLDAAEALIAQNGIHATGIDTILAKAGTAKMTLYNQFGSKEGLVVAMLERRGDRWMDWLTAHAAAHPGPPRARLLALFDFVGRAEFNGCPFVAAAGEHADRCHPVRTIASTHKAAVQALILDLCIQTGVADPEPLSRQIYVLLEGATAAALIAGCSAPAEDARAAATILLDAHDRPRTQR